MKAACELRRLTAARELALALLMLCTLAVASAAGPFNELVVFGDSLSDVGNVAQGTNAWYPLVARTPGQYYYNGRFSNGPVYVESFAAGLGLPAPVHSRSGGQNFAHGGAKTTGTSFPNSVVVRDIDDQVSDFLSTASADPDALFVVFASANDILDTQIANLANPVNRLRDSIDALVSAGARQFLVFNQPLMGETPRFNSNPANRTAYNARSTQFNTALTSTLDTLDDNLALTIFRFDVAALFNQALASPQSFGLTNTTASAAPGLTPGASSYNTNQIAPNADEYLFWDDLHPTATVHAALAKRALAVVSRGDFNWDGVVDAADYVIWRKEYSFVDFNEWRGNFGESAGMGAAASVPEPGLLASIAASVIIGVAASGRRRGKS